MKRPQRLRGVPINHMKNTSSKPTSDQIPMVKPSATELERSLRTFTHVTYGLMAWGVACTFTDAIPSIFELLNVSIILIAAGVMAHARRTEAKQYWLANHYRYLVWTFWITVLLQVVAFSFHFGFFGFSTSSIAALWSAYRVLRGWILLSSLKVIPDYSSE